MSAPSDLAVRVRRLEDVAFEGDGLRTAVERLGDSAEALADALRQVDRQQQTMATFSEQLAVVQQTALPRKEYEENRESLRTEAQLFAKRALRRTYVTATLLGVAALIGMLVLDAVLDQRRAAQVRVCDARNAQTELIIETLAEQGLTQDAERFRELVIDCKKELA